MLAALLSPAYAGCFKDGPETICTPPLAAISAPDGTSFLPGASFRVRVLGTEGLLNTLQLIHRVELHRNGVPVDAQTFYPNTNYADAIFNQSGLPPGTYTFQGKVMDAGGRNTMSAPIQVRINAAPSVALTAPASGTVYPSAPASVAMTATATDDAGITRVDFYANGVLVGTDSVAPYQATWSGAGIGTHTLFARAFDSDGQSADSAPVSIRVNAPPSVWLTAPSPGTLFPGPTATIDMGATASDTDSSGIARVEFYANGALVGSAASAPYTFSWPGVPTGTYGLMARAFDTDGGHADSATVSVQVSGAVPSPTVTLTSPLPGAMIPGPAATIPMAALVTDFGRPIARVEFLSGGTVVGNDTSAPYEFNWTGRPAGSYVLSARAVGTDAFQLISASVTVQVTDGAPTGVPITPPNLAGAVAGTMAGKHSVAPSGAAGYEIPLAVPPGTAGQAPALALRYDSHAREGALGLGWTLGGLSAITRCPATIAVDGARDRVALDARDRYCLDGQRLLLATGTYGGNATYRTELDEISRITSYGSDPAKGPDTWKVEHKGGDILYYGSSADSYVEAPGSNKPLQWALARSEDRRGNYLSYHYLENNATGEHLPSAIRYTGNGSSLVPYNAVRFEYEAAARPDPVLHYVAGHRLSTTKRLAKVSTWTGTASDGSGGTPVREWRIEYQLSTTTGLSLVQRVLDCAGATCLPATTFTYQARTTADNAFTAPGSGIWNGGPAVQFSGTSKGIRDVLEVMAPVDLNGDGKADLLQHTGSGNWQACLSTGTDFTCSTWAGPNRDLSQLLTGDFNGDGRTDLLVPAGASAATVCLSTGSAFTCSSWGPLVTPTSVVLTRLGLTTNYVVADINGDGRDDVVVRGSGGNCVSTGSGFSCGYASAASGFFDPEIYRYFEPENLCYVDQARWRPFTGDFNGDGKTDSLTANYLDPNCARQWVTSPNNGFTLCTSGGATGGTCQEATGNLGTALGFVASPGSMVGDLNGDGLADFVLGDLAGGTTLRVCYGTGAGGVDCTDVVPGGSDSSVSNLADLDGDGRPELWNNGVGGRVCRVYGGTLRCEARTIPSATGTSGYLYGDFNGDGRTDLALYNTSTNKWGVHLAAGPATVDVLTRVTDGLGHPVEFGYTTLADSTVYTRGADVAYPKRNVVQGPAIVSQVRVGNGQGGWLRTDYRYEGLRNDLSGRGSLGFAAISAIDQVRAVTTRTTYSQDFPTIGRPLTEVVTQASAGSPLSETTFTWQTLATAGSARHVYQASHSVVRRDLNGTVTTSTLTNVLNGGIDAYGNVTGILTTVLEPAATPAQLYLTLVSNTFDNTVSNWLIGRKRSETVNKQAPGAVSVVRTTNYDYDAYGDLLRETVESATTALKLVTEYGRHATYGLVTGRTLKWRDPVSASNKTRVVETTAYDPKWRFPATITNAKGHVQTLIHDAGTGQVLMQRDANALDTTWAYDAWGRKTREDRPDGTATTWAYRQCVNTCLNGAAVVTVTQNWSGAVQTTAPAEAFTDALGRSVLTRSWGFDGTAILQESRYNASGWLHQLSRPYFAGATPVWTYRDRDVLGRLIQSRAPDDSGTERSSTFSYNGLTLAQTNAKGQTRTEVRNGLGKLKSVTDAAGKTVSYQYDGFGNLLRFTDARGNQTQVSYDVLGRKTALADPNLGSWTYAVDPLGQTYRQQDAKGQVTTFTHDELGRLTRRLAPDQDSRWGYDTGSKGVGKLAEAYTWAGGARDVERLFSYDSAGRPLATTARLDWDYTETALYDAFGRPSGTRYQRNTRGGSGGPENTVGLQYNPMGYTAAVTAPVTTGGVTQATTVWQALAQDAEQRVISEQRLGGLHSRLGYNTYTGRLNSILSGPLAGAVVDPTHQHDSYSFDVIGNLVRRQLLTGAGSTRLQEDFGYDSLNRLTSAAVLGGPSSSTSYDDSGNITSKSHVGSYSYPAPGAGSVRPHAVTGITGSVAGLTNPSFSYDNNGNLTQGLNRRYTWTAANHPLAIDKLSGSSALQRTQFSYGPDNERVRQTQSPLSGGVPGAATTTIFYAGALEKEISTSANTTTLRTPLPLGLGYVEEKISGIAIAATTSGNRQPRFLLKDHLGSTLAIVDGERAVLQRLGYDAWGRRRQASGADDGWGSLGTLANDQDNSGYTGHEQLDQLGLVHMNARLYDPIIGRHTSADPTVPDPADPQAFNRYSYVLNNALAFTDPTGLAPDGSERQKKEKERQEREERLNISCGKKSTMRCGGGKEEDPTATKGSNNNHPPSPKADRLVQNSDLSNQPNQKSDISCSVDGRNCTKTTFEERFNYTGKMSVQWDPIGWDDPSLMKIFSVDVMALVPKIASKLPGFELKVEGATQRGEILHEARIDRQYYQITIVDQVETSRVPLTYVQGNSHRWMPAPGVPDLRTRIQVQSCVSVLCSEWKR
ncbi:Ig-like domain-containing protein [Pseudorhodoferax sp.]|uniref:Ig-like domain-containing protein n=1 Tax=Pseudorhodoferax sp. TaxID=1993553 RepID=UPI002DD69999|nr:Ig-like domain-containing protein [Pseudorhodoferax sp.]